MNNELHVVKDFLSHIDDIKSSNPLLRKYPLTKRSKKNDMFENYDDDLVDILLNDTSEISNLNNKLKREPLKETNLSDYKDYYIVFDLEFYNNNHPLGLVKQVGFIIFDKDYNILDKYDNTIIHKEDKEEISSLISKYFTEAVKVFHWGGKTSDIPGLKSLNVNTKQINFIDAQDSVRALGMSLKLADVYSKLTHKSISGAHNALVDTNFTFEIIKILNLADDKSEELIQNVYMYVKYGDKNSNLNTYSNDSNNINVNDEIKILKKYFKNKKIPFKTTDNIKTFQKATLSKKQYNEILPHIKNINKVSRCSLDLKMPDKNLRDKFTIMVVKQNQKMNVYIKK